MKRTMILALALLATAPVLQAQTRQAAFDLNSRLGKGINMGNAFEAPTETAWGNPWRPEYFKTMHDLGFGHVRVPVRWETPARSLSAPPYTVAPAFLDRIKAVVDAALANKLYVVFNMHHHDVLFNDPDGQKERFLSQWEQIATYFKDYPDSLLFEVLNEPNGNLTPEKWNVFFSDALENIRKTNPDRMVLMGTADWGGLSGIPYLELPDDENIILSIHYYNPFSFTHQGADWVGPGSNDWLGTEWFDTEAERETVAEEFKAAIRFSEEQHIPIHVGEFGAYSLADMDSRVRWTTFLARWFEQQGFSWAYWEFSAGFGIYQPQTGQVIAPLADALLTNAMPEPIKVLATPLYVSDFSNGNDGWNLSAQGGASGTLAHSNGLLTLSVANGGSEDWHIQLSRNNIPLKRGQMYRISFKGWAGNNRSGTFYAGRASDPWNAYSGYNGFALTSQEASFSTTFTMAQPDDPAARLVFDMGRATGQVSISEVRIDEITFGTGEDEEEIITALPGTDGPVLRLYPNPVAHTLHIESSSPLQEVHVYDLQGRKLIHQGATPSIDISFLAPGLYVLKVVGLKGARYVKIVKE